MSRVEDDLYIVVRRPAAAGLARPVDALSRIISPLESPSNPWLWAMAMFSKG